MTLLKLNILSEKLAENHYKIDIKPAEHGIPIRKQDVVQTYRLKDGSEAVYMTIFIFDSSNVYKIFCCGIINF
jgi:hypothetical protein